MLPGFLNKHTQIKFKNIYNESRYDLGQHNITWTEKEYGILVSQDNQAKTKWDFYASIFILWIMEVSVNDRTLTKLREKGSWCTSISEWNVSVTATAKAVKTIAIPRQENFHLLLSIS